MAAAAFALVAISSCDEDSINIGQSLTNESDKLVMNTANYDVSTKTIMADSVLSMAADCYFGRVKDPETGANVPANSPLNSICWKKLTLHLRTKC